ncbi:hypothetical protein FDUTEX481_01255 [Tolypothrix sp. PCC 7601]|nr:hypothetical protein FDUTEX481_01255 [Tolypothrix sp. PCC 7601]
MIIYSSEIIKSFYSFSAKIRMLLRQSLQLFTPKHLLPNQ